jgi:hypothetical protein
MSLERVNPDGTTRDRTDQLARQVYAGLLPTPMVSDVGGGPRQPDGTRGISLREVAATGSKQWPTPKSSISGPDYDRMNRKESGGDDLVTAVARSSRIWPTTLAGGSLNPQWVEWLMGFPIGWTDCDVSETPSSAKSSPTSDEQS